LPYALGIAESGDVIRLNNETNGQEVVYNQTGLPMTSKLAGRHIIIESGTPVCGHPLAQEKKKKKKK
jgi:hypothetical protein